jgi:hypothetical protein
MKLVPTSAPYSPVEAALTVTDGCLEAIPGTSPYSLIPSGTTMFI